MIFIFICFSIHLQTLVDYKIFVKFYNYRVPKNFLIKIKTKLT